MNWEPAIQRVNEHIVRIETQAGHGTGFLAFYNADKTWCGIATAAHVVQHADDWREPIKIRNHLDMIFLTQDQRVIVLDKSSDSAVIFFFKAHFQLPNDPITLRPIGSPCGIGTEVGWVGYPNIDPDTACFFSGSISARKEDRKAYYIDGVAIHGVSGSPVFHLPPDGSGDIEIIGAVSDYFPNSSGGQLLPGLAQARDVSHFHTVAAQVQSIDAARAAQAEFQNAPPSAGTTPSSSNGSI